MFEYHVITFTSSGVSCVMRSRVVGEGTASGASVECALLDDRGEFTVVGKLDSFTCDSHVTPMSHGEYVAHGVITR